MRRAIVMVGCVVFLLLVAGVLLYRRGSEEVPVSPRASVVAERSDRTPVVEAPPAPVVVEEAPIVEAAATAAPEPVLVEPKDGDASTGSLVVRVVEEGTRMALERVTVHLSNEGSVDSRRYEAETNKAGIVEFDEMTAGEYRLYAFWIRHGNVPVDMGVLVRAGEATDVTVVYPGRQAFLFRLIDPEGYPIAGEKLQVGFTTSNRWDMDAAILEEAVTGSDGTFFGLGYGRDDVTALATWWIIASEESLLMRKVTFPHSLEEDGFLEPAYWRNPLYLWRYDEGSERSGVLARRQDIIATRDLVQAEGILVGARDLGSNSHYVATVSGQNWTSGRLPMEDNRFVFQAPTSIKVGVFIDSASEFPEKPSFGSGRGRMYATWDVMEHMELVTLPDTPGPFQFEVHLPEPLIVRGRVVDQAGNDVAGVQVLAASPVAEAFPPELRALDIYGPVSKENHGRRSTTSTSRGDFEIALMPGRDYEFHPHPLSVPEEMRAYEPLRRSGTELAQEPEITLRLLHSSIIWGEVVDEEGNPESGSTVELFATNHRGMGSIASAIADEDGVFELFAPIGSSAAEAVLNDHYLLVTNGGEIVGLSAVTVDSEKPMRIVTRGSTVVVIEPPTGASQHPILNYTILYRIPGLDQVVRHGSGFVIGPPHNRTSPILRGLGRVEFRSSGEERPNPPFVDVSENAPDQWRMTIDVGEAQD